MLRPFLFSLFLMAAYLPMTAQEYTPKYELINKAEYPINDLAVATYNVLDYGADPTGKKDCSALFQTLLDKLAGVGTKSGDRGNYANPTGGVLYIPEGTYLIKSQLYIPRGVTMRGDWKQPEKGQPVKGTVLAIQPPRYAQGKSNASFSAITMQPTTEISNIAFWYPAQDIDNVTAFPPTILYGESGYWGNDYCNVRHCTFINSYIAIQFNDGNGGGCPNIFDVWGTPLYQGVVMDNIADVGRFDWLHFAPWIWADSGLEGAPSASDIRRHTRENATGFVMRRNDWSYTCNYECEGYHVGFLAEKSPVDGNKPNGHCYNMRFSDCRTGVQLTGISYCGYLFTRINTTGCSTGVELDGGCDGPGQFLASELAGSNRAILMENAAGSPLMLEDCTVKGRVLALGGELVSSNSTYDSEVVVNPTARLSFNGNTFTGDGHLTNNSLFLCEVSDDKLATRTLPAYKDEWMEIKQTRPTREALYVVTDAKYGASPVDITVALTGVADQSAAIQAALDDAGANGGGIVYLPAGHYRMDKAITIPEGVELKGASDLATVPKGNGAILEVMTGEGQEGGTPFITMAKKSGLRGLTVNYPNQTSAKAVKKYPYTVRGNADVYIVNLALRAAYQGVDLFTEKCDRHYVDFLSGHAFQNVIRVGGGCEDGMVTNIQCNTIAYACGAETKFGSWPNSSEANKGPAYGQNMEDLDFMIIGDCDREVLYNNFLFGCNKGMVFQDDGKGGARDVRALGNAVDGAVNTFVIDGIGSDLDLINSQVVALNHDDNIIRSRLDAYFITMGAKVGRQVTFFASDHWGGGNYFGKVSGGTLNLYLANLDQSGSTSTFQVANGAKVNMTTSRIKQMTKFAGTTGTEKNVALVSSILDLTGATTTSNFAQWRHNLGKAWTMADRSAFAVRTGWTATASHNSGNAYKAIDGGDATRWDTGGSQTNGQWFKVDMKSAHTFNTVLLDASGSASDGPAAYKVEVSDNNSSWRQVAEGTGGGAMLFITFDEAVTARYVRVTQTGSKGNYWSIHEFYVGNLQLASGIAAPTMDGTGQTASTRVYTLQGVPVGTSLDGLAHGVYIVVRMQGGKVVSSKKVTL